MQANCEKIEEDPDLDLQSMAKISEDFKGSLKISDELENQEIYEDAVEAEEEEEEEEEGMEEEEEEFSFMCEGASTSPIAAEDAFVNGKIKPIYPIFNPDLILAVQRDFEERFPVRPQVKKVFVEIKNDEEVMTSSGEISGPYCEWSKEAAAAAAAATAATPDGCKKSNSTGFSKLWRFKDLLSRSNSDGRDAFIFLNNQQPTTSSAHPTTSSGQPTSSSSSVGKKEEKKGAGGGDGEAVKVNEGKGKVKKAGNKNKTAPLSAHEIYLRNKAKDGDRRKSYLPYRPEVFGFFTNVNGGMSKNVHPF